MKGSVLSLSLYRIYSLREIQIVINVANAKGNDRNEISTLSKR